MNINQGDTWSQGNFFGSQGDENTMLIQVNDGYAWHKNGYLICLVKQVDGTAKVASIIKEQGPAVAMASCGAVDSLRLMQQYFAEQGDYVI